MKYFQIILFSVFLTFVFVDSANGQVTVEKSENQISVGGQLYYVHMVKAKQTLYSISKAYGVSEQEILRINPEAASGIGIDQILRIPTVPERETVLNHKNGKDKIFYHIVQDMENLMGISRRYDVSMAHLIELNSGAELKIKSGQYIRIPARGVLEPYDTVDLIKSNDTIIVHWVLKKETLFKLSRQYTVDIHTIYKYNPNVKVFGLKFDEPVLIPLYIGPEIIIADIVEVNIDQDTNLLKPCKNSLINPTYQISLFLPLHLAELYEIEYSRNDHDVREGMFTPFQYVQYLEGAKMAMDSLAAKGMKCEFRIVDTKSYDFIHHRDKVLRDHRDADLIFAPVDRDNALFLSEFALRHKIWYVNHWNTYLDTNRVNPYIINTTPIPPDQFANIIRLIEKKYKNSNIIVVATQGNSQLEKFAEDFYQLLQDNYKDDWEKPGMSYISYGSEGSKAAFERIQPSKQNIVIAFTHGEAQTSKFISELYKSAKKKEVILVGMPWWKNYNTLDNSYLNSLNTHLFASSFIEYGDEDVINFIRKFRKNYRTEPDYQNNRSFEGYDVTYYFGNLLFEHGKRFRSCFTHFDQKLFHTQFQFEINKINRNLDNKYINIYRFEDFELKLEE